MTFTQLLWDEKKVIILMNILFLITPQLNEYVFNFRDNYITPLIYFPLCHMSIISFIVTCKCFNP